MPDEFINKRLISRIDTLLEKFRPELLDSRLRNIERKEIDPHTANTDDLEIALAWLETIDEDIFSEIAAVRKRHPPEFWQNIKVFGARGLEEVRLLRDAQKLLREAYLAEDRPEILFKLRTGHKGLRREK